MNNKRAFRYDINALRALAVIAVVLYHFQIPMFYAGFIGVDIFFVISGFLMTSIVCDGVLSNRFVFKDFYVARARRIWPGLIVLCMALLVLGGFILITSDYKILASHVRESLLFTSNFKYLSEAGYFDQASQSKWLLHTWSLSVEWQFYLFYPVVVVLASKTIFRNCCDLKKLFILHVVFAVLFFVININYVSTSMERSFYSIESRAWEMLFGGFAYFLKDLRLTEKTKRVLISFTLLLLLLSFVYIDIDARWPGYLALLPTCSTFLIIVANKSNRFVRFGFFQWVGERSYSIYLWHWPLVVLIHYYGWHNLSVVSGFILLSLFLGHLSYLYVETPTRKKLSLVGVRANVIFLFLSLMIVLVFALVVRKDGLPFRLPAEVLKIESMAKDRNPRQSDCLNAKSKCVFGGENISVIVLGDSHADSTVTAVEAALTDSSKDGVLLRAASGCVYAHGAQRSGIRNKECEDMVDNIAAELANEHPGLPVLFINRMPSYVFGEHMAFEKTGKASPIVRFDSDEDFYSSFSRQYKKTLCDVSMSNPVFVLRTVPEMPEKIPLAMAKKVMRKEGVDDLKIPLSTYRARNKFTDGILHEAAQECGVKILDPEPYLCDTEYCYGVRDGVSIYLDDDHLSEAGNRLLIDLFKQVVSPKK